jgi:hypothetical protein
MPKGWAVVSNKSIAKIIGLPADVFSDRQKWMVEAAKKTIIDTAVQDAVTGNSMMIMINYLPATLGGQDATETDYLETAKTQMNGNKALSYTYEKYSDATIAGTAYVMMLQLRFPCGGLGAALPI